MIRTILKIGLIGLLSVVAPVPGRALEIVDVTGRTVTLERPAERVLLGEGRFLVALSLLAPDDPVARVAGLLNEFERLDPAGFARYAAAFPGLEDLPAFGQTTEESVSLESAIALQPDAAVFGISGHGPRQTSEHILQALDGAGIPVVFIDFRDDPMANTPASMRVLGRLLGREAAAERFARFYEEEVARVVDRVRGFDGPRPSVLLEARVGLGNQCCFTIASGMFADLIEAAGGRNVAAGRLPGATGVLNLEYVIAADPQVYIGSAIGNAASSGDANGRIILGAGVPPAMAQASLAAALERPGLNAIAAVRTGRAHGLWHHFYSSPFNVYALQRIATWLQPELFADLDPEETLATMLGWIEPVDLSGTYGVSVADGG